MSEMTMREKLARAIFNATFHPLDVTSGLAAIKWGEWPEDRQRAERQADAVLDVLAEPDEGMIEAFFECNAAAKTVFADPADLWRAMLDAARTPGAIEETGRRG